MSRLAESFLLALNRFFPNTVQALTSAKLDPADYVDFFGQRSERSFAEIGPIDWAKKEILDVGCGLGANLVYLCNRGAHRITALDIDTSQVMCAKSIHANHHPDYASSVDFLAADAATTPFAAGKFDLLISADTFEHVDKLYETLEECSRILRPGGRLYAFFPPFYAPWGAHMVNWIKLPWCQLIFSDSTILNVARRLEREGTAVNILFPPQTRLNLGEGNVIPFINHLTLGSFRRLIHSMPIWKVVEVRLLPLGWRSGRWISILFQLFTRLPLIQEAFTSRAVFVLERT